MLRCAFAAAVSAIAAAWLAVQATPRICGFALPGKSTLFAQQFASLKLVVDQTRPDARPIAEWPTGEWRRFNKVLLHSTCMEELHGFSKMIQLLHQ